MSLFKYLIPAAAVASVAFAQSSSNNPCAQATATVQNGGDASAIGNCPTFTGSVVVATQAAGTLDFGGVQEITGGLTAINATGLQVITANNLGQIGGTLDLEQLTAINALNFPNLTSVGNMMLITTGPQLQGLGWQQGLRNVGSLNIQDTFLQNLNGINLTSAQAINVANNLYLTNIDIPLNSITGTITLNANAAGKTVASFGNLTTAGGITISNCSTIDLSSLRNTSGAIYLNSNSFTNLSLPALTTSNGLTINNNNQMTSLNLPAYATDGAALNIQNNTDLTSAISLPALTHVTGSVYFIGAYSNVSTPVMNTIAGSAYLTSLDDISGTCSTFQNYLSSKVIQGQLSCNSGKGTATTSGSGSSSSGSSGSGSSSTASSTAKSGAAGVVAPAFTVLGALAAVFAMLA